MKDRIRKQTRARSITFIVCMFFFIFYLSLQGEQGQIVHLYRDDRYIYLSMGEYGSFQIYELRRARPQPQLASTPEGIDPHRKIYSYRIPLDKSQIILHQPTGELKIERSDVNRTIVQNNIMYVIDINRGFTIYDITQRNFPVKIGQYDFYGIHDLVFFDQIAFLAAGKAGLYILDLAVPDAVQIIGHYDTGGTVETVYPVAFNLGEMNIQTETDIGQVKEQKKQLYLAFVADGEAGYVVLDFKTGERVFREMTLLRAEDTPGYVYDIEYGDSYLFLADGNGGLRIYDIFASGFDPTKPIFLSALSTPGTAYQVVYHLDNAYIADGKGGLVIIGLRSQIQGQPQSISILSSYLFPTEITSLVLSKDIAIAGGNGGGYLVDISDSFNPVLINHLDTPGLATISQMMPVLFRPNLWSQKVTDSIQDMLKELLFGFGILILAILVFVPLVLPGWSFTSVMQSLRTFGKFLLGKVGQAVLVEDGEMITDPFLQDQSKTRPLILDNASAGLVQGREGNFHVAAPGTSSLEPGDALVKIIDLRARTYIFGPADEDPFEHQMADEDEIMARHRVRRRMETQAFTQDGVEIVPNIIVDFRVKSDSAAQEAPFGYQENYAFQALRKEYATDKNYMEGYQSGSLNRLPGELAVKVWREHVQYYNLENLFSPLEGNAGLAEQRTMFGLEYVIESVNRFLKQQFVDEIGQDGRKTGRQVFSEAFNELEQAGLEVSKVWILNSRIDPEKGDNFLIERFALWFDGLHGFQQQVQALYSEIEAESKQQALIEFTRNSIQSLAEGLRRYQDLPEKYIYLNQSLYLLLRGTRTLGRIGPAEKLQLDQLLVWLESGLEL